MDRGQQTTPPPRNPESSVLAGVASLSLIVLVPVVVHVLLLHGQHTHAQRNHLEMLVRLGQTRLTDYATHELRDTSAPEQAREHPLAAPFRRWAWTVLQEEEVRAAVLVDESSQAIAQIPRDVVTPEFHFAGVPEDGLAVETLSHPFNDRTESWWSVAGRMRDVGEKAHGVGIVLFARQAWYGGVSVLSCVWLAAAVGMAGLAILLYWRRWLWLRYWSPLHSLARAAATRQATGLSQWSAKREDALGHIARALEDLLGCTRQSEERATRLERTMDSRVEDQTRQINNMLQRAERAGWLDPLTGLGNRRLLEDRLEQVFEALQRRQSELSAVMLDLDNFKNLNDTMGHAAGDEMLRFLGDLLRGTLRPTDLGVRYGGDEFVLILPDTTPEEAATIVERLVRLYRQRASTLGVDPPVSISAGIASMRRDGAESGQHLLDLADRAQYNAKSAGKNRLCVAP
ncbi:MAG: diguanylate cyclase [bacterium]|nr:diguanylate cyclase [bacterium]